MLGWLLSVFLGCYHRWELVEFHGGIYRDSGRYFIVNTMKCKKCGLHKPVQK